MNAERQANSRLHKGRSSTINLISRFNRGCKGFFLVTFLLLIGDMASYLLPPFFQQVYTDNIITHKNPEWFTPLMIIYALLFVLELTMWLLLNPLRRREFAKMGIHSSSRYVRHLLELPMSAIDRFTAGELVARYSSIKNIGMAMDHFSYALVLVIRPLLCAWLLVMYSWKLGMVVVLSMVFLVVVMRFTASTIKKKAKGSEETDARLQGVTMAGIKSMETIKSMGDERLFFAKWEEAYVRALNARVGTTMMTMSIGSLPLLVLNLCNALILCLGAWYILQGELTPGMLLASQALATSIIFPINSVVNSTQEIYRSHAAMERLEEVEEASQGHSLTLSSEDELPDEPKLLGEVELRNVTFGYDRNNPPVLKNFSLKISPGQQVAFVGFSGCGKSTIAKLISGLYEPWEGEVLLDGVPVGKIDRSVKNNSLSVVNQDITLFEGPIADNIKMWDESIEDFSMVMAAHDAQIHEDIVGRPGAYQSLLAENGKNFSGGQRQRIEIATALAKDPSILIMDEGTSALDPKTEELVMGHIRQLGITTIMIAHRLTTIRDCDIIYVLERGQLIQQGSHEELMQQEGLYSELIKYA
ncbi:MAG: ATP-binding cassette domain-containing protein [Bacteroidaceae bacterium]|nr:ATP-binding cassette domain-containing protein [Bacteroidaceae bacterium]